jgi:hypothetical protein
LVAVTSRIFSRRLFVQPHARSSAAWLAAFMARRYSLLPPVPAVDFSPFFSKESFRAAAARPMGQ